MPTPAAVDPMASKADDLPAKIESPSLEPDINSLTINPLPSIPSRILTPSPEPETTDVGVDEKERVSPTLDATLPDHEAPVGDNGAERSEDGPHSRKRSPPPNRSKFDKLLITEASWNHAVASWKRWRRGIPKEYWGLEQLGNKIFQEIQDKVLSYVHLAPGDPEFDSIEIFFREYVDHYDLFEMGPDEIQRCENFVGACLLRFLSEHGGTEGTMDHYIIMYLAHIYCCVWVEDDGQKVNSTINESTQEEVEPVGKDHTAKEIKSAGAGTKYRDQVEMKHTDVSSDGKEINLHGDNPGGGEVTSVREEAKPDKVQTKSTRKTDGIDLTNLVFLTQRVRSQFTLTSRECIRISINSTDSDHDIYRKGFALGRETRIEIFRHFSGLKKLWDATADAKQKRMGNMKEEDMRAEEVVAVHESVEEARKQGIKFFEGCLTREKAHKFLDCFIMGFDVVGMTSDFCVNYMISDVMVQHGNTIPQRYHEAALKAALKIVGCVGKYVETVQFRLRSDSTCLPFFVEGHDAPLNTAAILTIIDALGEISGTWQTTGFLCFQYLYKILTSQYLSHASIVYAAKLVLSYINVMRFPGTKNVMYRHSLSAILDLSNWEHAWMMDHNLEEQDSDEEFDCGRETEEEMDAEEARYVKLIMGWFAKHGKPVDERTILAVLPNCEFKILDTIKKIEFFKGWN
ncbi:hypothetical protein MBM_04411 [Drepanopeziza brunnea f. sp. 'multigermtubi' MB_m1]|uniref:Uncharacterized protein n=2 Tax=Drepanopeziza brunnea f. sp. 'multigermtubi' TaxID=698441 RepID=K1WIT0_MARBU|nr:uncharacterized protein MBM_04411 [Drepanopeziza brunnea f. sp. 'multigermtubi' MB_m1]EKD17550.1 hypothetical protein MBM_04411 [Drepanopeziza brunnea f. sp. 'multigermtubi' MB_m1]